MRGVSEFAGYIASILVLSTFMARDMRVLRAIAIASNVTFIAYGALAGLVPILCLHVVLLPLNVYRLLELREPVRMRRQKAFRVMEDAALRRGESPGRARG